MKHVTANTNRKARQQLTRALTNFCQHVMEEKEEKEGTVVAGRANKDT